MRIVRNLTVLLLVGIALASTSGLLAKLISSPGQIEKDAQTLLAQLLVPTLVTIAVTIGVWVIFRQPFATVLKNRPGLALGTFVFVLIFGATVIALWATDQIRYDKVADRFAADTLVATGGLLVLGLAAGIIGVLGFAEAVLRPHFRVQFGFLNSNGSLSEVLQLAEDTKRAGGPEGWIPLRPVTVKVLITNDGQVDAAHAFALVRFRGLVFSGHAAEHAEHYAFSDDSDHASMGMKLQWRGGADTLIYREMPAALTFSLNTLWAVRSEGIGISLSVLADRATTLKQRYRVHINQAAALALEGSVSAKPDAANEARDA